MTKLRIFASTDKARGDVLTRLAESYFLTLGYGDCRFDTAKSGREVDVLGAHLTEQRHLVAECKAKKSAVGGSDINKFIGVLDAEKKQKKPEEVVGYFVSLAGFTSTAIQQEEDLGGDRFIMVAGPDVVERLIIGNVIAPLTVAVEAAVGLVEPSTRASLRVTGDPELVGSDIGWTWLIYLGDGHEKTHYAFIHADGEPLSSEPASLLSSLASSDNLDLSGFSQLARPIHVPLREIRQRYYEYLAHECGSISLEGLPVDEGLSERRLSLRQIYVPLAFGPMRGQPLSIKKPARRVAPPSEGDVAHREDDLAASVSLPDLLASNPRLALLGAPGCGKSTVLKRIAMGYSSEEVRELEGELLPEADCVPLFVRCRQLDGLARQPFREILSAIAARAEIADEQGAFDALVDEALHSGRALVLIDGLDEIADASDRSAFVQQLRIFLSTHAAVRVIVTSREVGFRHVAGEVSSVCTPVRVAPLPFSSVLALTIYWFRLSVGESESDLKDAQELANVVYDTDRVRPLATNPLLLTTLLLVRRWVGEVPRKRTVLYDRAVDVLLMTWNVEAHEPIRREEAIPQLAYAAYSMMVDGAQTVSRPRLEELLREARTEMPAVLGFVELAPAAFIRRVEERSSLLSQTGHAVENGLLVELFEFRHLSFQEYLAAVALAEGYLPVDDRALDLADLVSVRLGDDWWIETFALLNVLAGARVAPLLRTIISALDKPQDGPVRESEVRLPLVKLLTDALADDALLSPDDATQVYDAIIEHAHSPRRSPMPYIDGIPGSKFGPSFRVRLEGRWRAARSADRLYDLGAIMAEWVETDAEFRPEGGILDVADMVLGKFATEDEVAHAWGCFRLMTSAYHRVMLVRDDDSPAQLERSDELVEATLTLLETGRQKEAFPASWAIAWLLRSVEPPAPLHERLISACYGSWTSSLKGSLRRFGAWALSECPPVPRNLAPLGALTDKDARFLGNQIDSIERLGGRRAPQAKAAIVANYYLGGPLDDTRLIKLLAEPEPDLGPSERSLEWVSEALGAASTKGRSASRKRPKPRARP